MTLYVEVHGTSLILASNFQSSEHQSLTQSYMDTIVFGLRFKQTAKK